MNWSLWESSVHANDRQHDPPPNKQFLRAHDLLCLGLDSHCTWSHVNLRLWHMWLTVAGVTYTYIEYSLYVPLLFLWEGGSQRDGQFQRHFQWQSTNAGPLAEQEAVKRLELLACSSKHPLLVWGPSKGQYTVTSQKLDSWLVAPRSRGGEEGHSAASHVLFVTFIWLSYAPMSSHRYPCPSNLSLASFLIKWISYLSFYMAPSFHSYHSFSQCCCTPPFLSFHFLCNTHPFFLSPIFPGCR